MHYMLCKNRVTDYDTWRQVFDSHAEAHGEAGLKLLHVLRDTIDPNSVVFLFEIHDLEKATTFTGAPEAEDAAATSGVVGKTGITILSD